MFISKLKSWKWKNNDFWHGWASKSFQWSDNGKLHIFATWKSCKNKSILSNIVPFIQITAFSNCTTPAWYIRAIFDKIDLFLQDFQVAKMCNFPLSLKWFAGPSVSKIIIFSFSTFQLWNKHDRLGIERGPEATSFRPCLIHCMPWPLFSLFSALIHHLWCLALLRRSNSSRNRTTSRRPFWAAMERGVSPSSFVPSSLLAPDSTSNRTTSRCPSWAAMKRGVPPTSVAPWFSLAPASSRNRTTSRWPYLAAMKRGVSPVFVTASLSAPDATRNWATSRWPVRAAWMRGVDPSSVVAWSWLAPDSTRNRTISRCPVSAAMRRGVAPSSDSMLSLLAPDCTSNRTTSRCPFWAAMNRGVAPPMFAAPCSLLAPASMRRETHERFPRAAAAQRGVLPFSSSKLGFRGRFKFPSTNLSSFLLHASMNSRSASLSGGSNSRITSCTTWVVKAWSSSSGQLLSRSRNLKRGTLISSAKRCFRAL